MEEIENIVIVGAGIAGLATALGLHRMVYASLVTGLATTQMSFMGEGKWKHEVGCVRRNMLLEALAKELPQGTIRFGSKVISIEQTENLMQVYFANGYILKTKVLIGCDGVNSVVAKWLGLRKPAFAGRSAIRGSIEFLDGHGFMPEFPLFLGNGFRFGFLPCDDKTIYRFLTYYASPESEDIEDDPAKVKKFVLSKLHNVPKEVINIVEETELETIFSAPVRFRFPWNVLWGDICKGTVCVAGDAFHPMTPDIGHGGCAALEEGVILARCLGEALQGKPREVEDYGRIKRGLEKYAKRRRWRGFELIATAYVLGFLEQSDGVMMNFLREKCLAGLMAGVRLKCGDFDCAKLYSH